MAPWNRATISLSSGKMLKRNDLFGIGGNSLFPFEEEVTRRFRPSGHLRGVRIPPENARDANLE
jgi:hypothetical protein